MGCRGTATPVKGRGRRPRGLSAWLPVPAAPCPCPVSLGELLNLSEPPTGAENNIGLIRPRR